MTRRSISKQRGAEMSSRFTAPKVGPQPDQASRRSRRDRLVSSTIGMEFSPPKVLNSALLPSMTGSDAAGPMSPRPEHGAAVADHGHQTVGPGVFLGQRRIGGDGAADLGDARGVGDGQCALGVQRRFQLDREFATLVGREDLRVVNDNLRGLSTNSATPSRYFTGPRTHRHPGSPW